MPDQPFRALFSETENVRWDSVGEVRRRARRRTLARSTGVAGLVAVALVSGGVAVAQDRGRPLTPPIATPSPVPAPTTPSPSASPAPPSSSTPTTPRTSNESSPITGVTSAMMLRPQDVGSGYAVVATGEGDWTFEFGAAVLGCPRGTRPDPVTERERTLRKGAPQDEDVVIQHTGRYAAGAAARYLDSIRDRVSSCASVRITAEGFAGDEAVLVRFDHGGGSIAKTVLVREGDVLTEIFSKPTRGDAETRELGRRAAARIAG